MLLENSLYSTPAEKAALLADKKKVMDALCFSLLGFLGCFKLGDSRAALKTYDSTEGKLQLNAIGDTNHDVSLSVKLAEEAGVIPTSAAQNVTKLLYKIKSKTIKGKDLDDQIVRDTIKTLKISSNPPDSMVNAVVMEFEAGKIDLGQLAAKLYNLSKLPKFKTVSGEFRQLVMKGTFTDLFNKTPAPVGAAVKISNTPVVPTVVTPVLSKWSQVKDKESVYIDIFRYNYVTSSSVPRELLNIGITADDVDEMKEFIKDATAWLVERVFVKKDASYFNSNVRRAGSYYMERWRGVVSKEEMNTFARCFLCGYWLNIEPKILEGEWAECANLISEFSWFLGNPAVDKKYSLDVFTEAFFEKITSDASVAKGLDYCLYPAESLGEVVQTAWMVAGGRAPAGPEITLEASDWRIPESLGRWMIRALAQYDRNKASNFTLAVYKTIQDDDETIRILNKAFELKAPVSASRDVAGNGSGSDWIVPIDVSKVPSAVAPLAKMVNKSARPFGIDFVDIANWEDNFKKVVSGMLSKSITPSFWYELLSTSRSTRGMPPGYVSSEPFMDWFCSQMDGTRAVSVFKVPPTQDQNAGHVYLNMAIHLLDTKGVSPAIWLNVYSFAVTYVGATANTFVSDLEAIYEENADKLQKTVADAYSTDTKMTYASGSVIMQFLLRMHKAGKFKPDLNNEFWVKVAMFSAAELGEWDIPDKSQEYLFSSNQAFDTNAVAKVLLTKYPHSREFFYKKWMEKTIQSKMNPVTSFIQDGHTDIVSEAEVPKDILDFVKASMDTIDAHEVSYFDANSHGFGVWLQDMVKDYIIKSLDANTDKITIQGLINALRTLDNSTFNSYVDKLKTPDVIKGLAIKSVDEGIATVHLWTEIEKDISELNIETITKLIIAFGMNIQNADFVFDMVSRKACIEIVCNTLNSMVAEKGSEVDKIFDSMSYAVNLKKAIVDWFSKAGVLANALKSIKTDVIAPFEDVDHTRLGQLMKYNNINLPTSKDVDYKQAGFKLSDFLKSHGSWKMEPLAVTIDIEDQKSCDRRTADFDLMNKYRHGQIGVKFLKSFNVDLPIQREKNIKWDDDHKNDEVMDPVFHGTGSVAASFILRYGFAVFSANDPSVVGRMLGNGIYFSNVLDKCGQYVSDGGYSRGIGNKGYLFQMRANLGKRGSDYQAGGGNLVSPEWCVFHPNDQLKIYKAHFIELVDKSVVAAIKQRVSKLNESTAVRITEMVEHLNDELQNSTERGCVSYTFIDGTIPISTTTSVPFEQWDPSLYGSHITMESSGLGPIIYIAVEDQSVCDMFAVRYTAQFMTQGDDFLRYLQLMGLDKSF
jgi:hypothetical protein